MLLKISYEDGSGREVIPLSANETYFVGESSTLSLPAGAGVVRLRGSHVSSPQFVLRKSGQGWSVQHHGRNPTRVDDQPLRAGTLRSVCRVRSEISEKIASRNDSRCSVRASV